MVFLPRTLYLALPQPHARPAVLGDEFDAGGLEDFADVLEGEFRPLPLAGFENGDRFGAHPNVAGQVNLRPSEQLPAALICARVIVISRPF
jgi:hypothetical protein